MSNVKNVLRQKGILENRRVALCDDHVQLTIESRTEQRTVDIPYGDIGPKVSFRSEKLQPNYGMHVITRNLAVVFLFASLFGAYDGWRWFGVMLASSAIFFVFHTVTARRFLVIETDKEEELALFREKPSSEEVDDFVEALFDRRNGFLKDRFHEERFNENIDRRAWLQWLRRRKVFSEVEYEAELVGLEAPVDGELN
ncbi:hypothetical protein ABI59_19875 [Acidobacteria bacterium Mor1]|nr:hypothetical protein ABI59_19875 [Acidobacteria bacterium Mor1]